MRTINHIIMICGAALLLLAGCTSDLSLTGRSGCSPLRLSAAPTTGLTRAADGLYTSSSGFDGGEQVEVYVNSSSAHGTYQVNSTSKTALDATNAANTLYYPTSGDANLYAVYPAASTESHTVKYDQTTEENYKASDLMYASKTVTQANKTSTQELQFGHQLVKLKVQIIKAAGVTSVTKVEMQNVKRRVSVSANASGMSLTGLTSATGETGTGANEDKILVFSGSNTQTEAQTYAVVFPVQLWSNQDFITVTADGKEATYKLTKDNFAAGSEYTLTLNINATALNNTVSITGWTGNQGSCEVQPTVENGGYDVVPGLFSVSSTTKVLFAQGNLQATWDGSSWTWAFAPHQWSYIGDATTTPTGNGNTSINGNGTLSANGIVDLFGWVGSSSTWTSVARYGITSAGTDAFNKKDGYGDSSSDDLNDWGVLIGSGWRTLTKDEWTYLFNTRTVNGGTGAGKSYTLGQKVNNVLGVVIYPDGYTGSAYTTESDWRTFESAGCVFLPAAGYRDGTSVNNAGSNGGYWSSTAYDELNAYSVGADPGFRVLYPASLSGRQCGKSVRLVRPAWYKEVSSATSSDIGKIICSNGHIHTNVNDVTCGGTAVAMIVYVGAAGSADDSNSSYKGLAIALTDASTGAAWYGTISSYSSTCVYQNSTFSNHYGYADMKGIANTNQMADKTGNCASHTTHAAATAAKNYSSTVAVPANCSQWFLPTSGQWLRFLRNSTLNLTWSDWGWSTGGGSDFTKVNKMFTDAGASGAVFSSGADYCSSSEYSAVSAVYVAFNSSYGVLVNYGGKYNAYRVRAFLAF